jgi:hypothetical protein
MAFQEGTDEIVCRECGAVHTARWYRMPVKEVLTIRCKACGGVAFAANTLREYTDVTLVRPD